MRTLDLLILGGIAYLIFRKKDPVVPQVVYADTIDPNVPVGTASEAGPDVAQQPAPADLSGIHRAHLAALRGGMG